MSAKEPTQEEKMAANKASAKAGRVHNCKAAGCTVGPDGKPIGGGEVE